jgi:hypothetical protein
MCPNIFLIEELLRNCGVSTMLTIGGSDSEKFCDGLSRRQFLQIGGLAMGGLSLTELLALEAKAGIRKNHKAIIMVFLPGGPPHQDIFDLKPEAPSEIRGEFKPIKTNVSGMEICELMPRMAKIMDKCTIIRSLVGARDEHAANICLSGYTMAESSQNHAPSMGAVLSKVAGAVDKTVPPFIGLSPKMGHMPWADPGTAGFLGLAHSPLQPDGQLMADMVLKGISLERLLDRKRMLESMDRYRKQVDSLEGIDSLHQKAFDLLTSKKLVDALDITKEDPRSRERYGKGTEGNVDDGGPCWNHQLLMARRLVEAGARCVTIGYGRWDYHGANFSQLRRYLPMLDQCLSALIEDIHARGMDKDVSVVVWGEFGRTPTINKDAGRDHWPKVSCALMAGGGLRHGQVIGSTTRFAEEAADRPVDYKDVLATLYHAVGVDVANTPIPDQTGRPNYLLDGHDPLPEMV